VFVRFLSTFCKNYIIYMLDFTILKQKSLIVLTFPTLMMTTNHLSEVLAHERAICHNVRIGTYNGIG
jgi:hypothetical protein